MKNSVLVIVVGIFMTVIGTSLFYTIQGGSQIETLFRMLKHTGTFVGLLGMGVIFAGFLLYVINRSQPEINNNFDT
ncbi:MAG: hypothetical protein EXS75_00915 [Nitrosarchaeum sp.]|nr:hypothetical protein [Nitrosarchaeum sp.]